MLKPVSVVVGSDPELFFEKDGIIVGAEKVIPKEGLTVRQGYKPSVVLDGVQVELNPKAAWTVPGLGLEVGKAFRLLKGHLGDSGVSISFKGVVEVSRVELDSLSPNSRILGCLPSKNIYGNRPITVDPKTYRKRSAGGHEHFGLRSNASLFSNRVDLVALFDMFVGNTCVMVDRDPGAAERRENYGRAGEFRTPKHGLEYRTLSNFWLRNYSLMSFVFGMAGIGVAVLDHGLSGQGYIEDELIEAVDLDKFALAINTNNYDLARENFEVVRPFLVKYLPKSGFPLTPQNIDKFLVFTEGVRQKGLEVFFPENPVDAWCSGKQVEFVDFVETIY
jgi:hypothetical protein